MATRSEIVENLDSTRDNILHTIDEISNTVQKKLDVQEQVRRNPYAALTVAAILGFSLAAIASPLGRHLLRFGFKSATATAGAYLTKRGLDFVAGRVMHQ